MNWIHAFELICYGLSAVLITNIIRRRNICELKLFLAGTLAGFALELLAVRVTDIYHYNAEFWLNLGTEPYQFPVFGGLMWGGLSVCALRLARKLGFGKVMTAMTAGFLIVSMDLLLDVVAIRLDGGFWVWEGRDINTRVDHHMWMSVIWVNFLGYLFETPMVTWLSMRDSEKGDSRPWWKHLLASVLIAFGGIAFVGIASGISLWLNAVTDEWFACIAFILLWSFIAVAIIVRLFKRKTLVTEGREILAVNFFAVMYIYCFAAMISLGIFQQHIWLAVLGIVLLGITTYIGE